MRWREVGLSFIIEAMAVDRTLKQRQAIKNLMAADDGGNEERHTPKKC